MSRNAENALLRRVLNRVNNFDGSDNADAQQGQSDLGLAKSWGNPSFQAQFDVNIIVRYFTVAAGVYTASSYASLPGQLQNGNLSAFVFGQADFVAGYAKLRSQYPVAPWIYSNPAVFGKEPIIDNFSTADATARAAFQVGDVVMPFTAVSGSNYVAYVIYRSFNVAYATLLQSLSSDTFNTRMIRYTINTGAQQVQYNNGIGVYDQTLFGRLVLDSVSSNAFKLPEQNQAGIIDLPIKKGIDKNSSFAMYLNPIAVDINLSFFVTGVQKIVA